MDTLFHRFGDKIKGVIEGFDRIVFKGILNPICYTAGLLVFLHSRGILNKEYKCWVQEQTATIISEAEKYSVCQIGSGIQYLPSSRMHTVT